MKLISLGKFEEKLNYAENRQDYQTWTEMSKYFDEIYLFVLSPDADWHHENMGKIDITWVPKNRSFSNLSFIMEAYPKALQLINEKDIDVIDVGEPFCAGPLGVRLRKVTGNPLVVQLQGQFLNLPGSYGFLKRKALKYITKYVIRYADRIRVVSNEIKKSVIKEGINANKIYVSPSRCDTEAFNADRYQTERKYIRSNYRVSDDEVLLVFTGRLISAKDVMSIVIAMPEIVRKHKSTKLLIVGDGPDREKLERKTDELAVRNNVFFVGMVEYIEIPKYLAAGDIFVSPSLDEGMPRSVLEALSSSLAAIVTPVGGNPEIIEDGVNGVFVKTQSPDMIAQKVTELTDDRKKLELIRNNGRRTIEEKYEFKNCIEKFAKMHYFES